MWVTLPWTRPKGIGPNALESQLQEALSPSTQQCPSGILVILRDPGSHNHSPGSAINLFTNNSLWLLGHLNKTTSPWEKLYCSRHHLSAKMTSPGSNTRSAQTRRQTIWICAAAYLNARVYLYAEIDIIIPRHTLLVAVNVGCMDIPITEANLTKRSEMVTPITAAIAVWAIDLRRL